MSETIQAETHESRNQNRGGGQPGNRNAMRAGLHAGKLPEGCGYISNSTNRFRRQIEDEVLSAHGEIGVYRAALIQSAVRHETRAKLLQRWLRKQGDGMKLMDKAALLAQISSATDSRDKCLERLKIDRADFDPFAALYSQPPQPTEDSQGAGEGQQKAAGGESNDGQQVGQGEPAA